MDETSTSSSGADGSSSSSSVNISDNNTNTKANSPSNEELLRISTSSSWTILPASRIEILESSGSEESTASAQVAGGGEQPSVEDEQPIERKLVEDPDTQAEDVSDGISIISDCESTGRLSPHPFLREHLSDLGFKYDGLDMPSLANLLEGSDELQHQLIRDRRRATMEGNDSPTASMVHPHIVLSPPDTGGYRLPTLVQSGLTAVFYVGATLAILAFVGRLRNPEWQVLGDEKPLAQLEQRLVELELQNNLMRAEIDIMSKQLQYLNTLIPHGQAQSQSQSQATGRKPKTFKAWPGNGNAVDPIDITKADLKRPFKCPDGKYEEIVGMCMESQPHAESLADEIGNVVNDVLQQSQAFQHFEKVTERLGTLAGQDAEQASDAPKAFHAHGNTREPTPATKPQAQPNARADASRERYKAKHNHKRQDHSQEQSREHSSRYRSNEHDSKERKRHGRKGKDSKEQMARSKRAKAHGDDSGSDDWHERMMQHRELSRQRHEQRRKNNWLIERGGSREKIRSGEMRL